MSARHFQFDILIEPSLRPMVAKLRARYPGIEVTAASIEKRGDVTQQEIRFCGPLDMLLACGLVTPAMVENSNDSRRGAANTPIGDGYSLFTAQTFDSKSATDHWALSMFTGSRPRERARISVTRAARELKRIMRMARGCNGSGRCP